MLLKRRLPRGPSGPVAADAAPQGHERKKAGGDGPVRLLCIIRTSGGQGHPQTVSTWRLRGRIRAAAGQSGRFVHAGRTAPVGSRARSDAGDVLADRPEADLRRARRRSFASPSARRRKSLSAHRRTRPTAPKPVSAAPRKIRSRPPRLVQPSPRAVSSAAVFFSAIGLEQVAVNNVVFDQRGRSDRKFSRAGHDSTMHCSMHFSMRRSMHSSARASDAPLSSAPSKKNTRNGNTGFPIDKRHIKPGKNRYSTSFDHLQDTQ